MYVVAVAKRRTGQKEYSSYYSEFIADDCIFSDYYA
jgi:hypothetical protein